MTMHRLLGTQLSNEFLIGTITIDEQIMQLNTRYLDFFKIDLNQVII
jgi:hypothetical protein